MATVAVGCFWDEDLALVEAEEPRVREAGCRLHGVGSHASGFYATLVLIGGIEAQCPPLADAVPN